MDNWFKSKWIVLVISFVFAILLFVVVQIKENDNSDSLRFFGGSEEMEQVEDVPVNINIDEDKYVVSGVPETVTATLKGSTSLLKATARQRNFDVFVDLSDLSAGKHTVNLETKNVPSGLKAYIEPKQIEINIEKRKTKEFPINVDFINKDKIPAGYELGDYQLKPETVKVTSSEGVIDKIGIVKVFVDATGTKESIDHRELPINVYDSQGNELNVHLKPENAVISVDVHHPSKTVPVKVITEGKLPKGYTLKTAETSVDDVKAYAKTDILKDLTVVKTEKIDLTDIKESQKIDVALDLPDDVSVPDVKKIPVTVEIEQTKDIKEVPISVKNLPKDHKVTFIKPKSGSLDVKAVGKESAIDKLTIDDLDIKIDAGDLKYGTQTVPIKIDGPKGSKYTTSMEKVTINIS